MQTAVSQPTLDHHDTMEGKGFAFRLLPFLAAKQTENLMYGTVFEVGFASGSSYLDNTGINAIAER